MCEISVILPVYNGEDHIEESIESVLSQTYQEFELIIVNDCSTDRTLEIIERYAKKDKRIKIVDNIKNLKLPRSLNEGFRNAKGKYYTWTSDDNMFLPNAFERMMAALATNPEAGMVYCDYEIINESGQKIGKRNLPEPQTIYTGNCIGACFLYRSNVAKKVGEYSADMFLAEDYDYWLRIYKESPIIHIREGLYLYRNHDKSLTATRLQEVKSQTVKVWINHLDFILEHVTKQKERCEFFDIIYEYVAVDERKEIVGILNNYISFYIFSRWKRRCMMKLKNLKSYIYKMFMKG